MNSSSPNSSSPDPGSSKRRSTARAILRALRPHQWVKNLLLIVPLFLAHQMGSESFPLQLRDVGLGFLAFSGIASAIYLINDVVDVESDKQHPIKCRRPIASGELPVHLALTISVTMVILSGLLSFFRLPVEFTAMMATYLIATSLYSLWLKRVALLDVFTLGGLYTLRLLAGGAAAGVDVSTWLMAFSMFIFSSLAFVKRFAELRRVGDEGQTEAKGRGYETGDLSLIESMGLASGYLAVLVLALYINSTTVQELYGSPRFLWLLCPILMYWISRIWMLAKRRRLSEDPVVFAATDPVSWLIGALAVAMVLLARLV